MSRFYRLNGGAIVIRTKQKSTAAERVAFTDSIFIKGEIGGAEHWSEFFDGWSALKILEDEMSGRPSGTYATRFIKDSLRWEVSEHDGELVTDDQCYVLKFSTEQTELNGEWRQALTGMVEYAECNDPNNPWIGTAKALLASGEVVR